MKRYFRLAGMVLCTALVLSGCKNPPTTSNPGSGGTPPPVEGGGGTTPPPTPTPPPVSSSGDWSDPNVWPSGKVPAAGDSVTIPPDKEIVLDVSPPALRSLTIMGTLKFADKKDISLATDWIMLEGRLSIGSSAQPYTGNATITLTDTVKDENIMSMGDRGIFVMGGTLELFGKSKTSWTKLSETAPMGATSVDALSVNGWEVGDSIVLASTDFNPKQAEQKVIKAINATTLELDSPLRFEHFGQVTLGVDERGEVGMLSHNIKIQGDADAATAPYLGGHIMAGQGGKIFVSSVELFRMGQHLKNGRYPVHWHLEGDTTGQYFINSSIHHSNNRCVTIHGTNGLLIKSNTTYDNIGHCFFLEDGIETGNTLDGNLGVLTRCHPTKPCSPFSGNTIDTANFLLPSDKAAATFWITNPANTVKNNVAAGSEQNGIWIALPEHPNGAFLDKPEAATVWPRKTNFTDFSNNTAHSNIDGLMFDRGPNADGTFDIPGNNHQACADPNATNCQTVTATVNGFTAFKNRNNGIWARGFDHILKNLKLADNAIGITQASGKSSVVDSVIVGESGNKGNPTTNDETTYGRSLPRSAPAGTFLQGGKTYPIHGLEFYDSTNGFENVTFRNFLDNSTRQSGALSYLFYTDFPISSKNFAKGAVFENAKPVFFPDPSKSEWAFENGGKDGYRSAVFSDDGSVGGKSYITINDPFLVDSDCTVHTDWNAAACSGSFGRVSVNATNAGAIQLKRTDNNAVYEISRSAPSFFNGPEASLKFGHSIEVSTENSVNKISVSVREGKSGDWSIFKIANFGFAQGGSITNVADLSALEAASKNSYTVLGGALYLKLFVGNGFFGASVDACSVNPCP